MNRIRTLASISLLVFFCAAVVVVAAAQEYQPGYPKTEIFAGYQYTRFGGSGGINANGWNTAATANFNRWFGVTADFSGAYKTVSGVHTRAYMYTFGPTFAERHEHVTPFVHVLAGGFHASADVAGFSSSTTGFAMVLGGGVDVKVSDHLAIRAVQPDWILWRSHGVMERKIARVSTGVLVRF